MFLDFMHTLITFSYDICTVQILTSKRVQEKHQTFNGDIFSSCLVTQNKLDHKYVVKRIPRYLSKSVVFWVNCSANKNAHHYFHRP